VVASSPLKTEIVLKSRPYARRAGLYPMIFALGVSWVFTVAWFSLSFWLINKLAVLALAIAFATTAFAVFLAYMSYRLVVDSYRHYVFEVTDSEAVLKIDDRWRHKQTTKMVLLADVTYAEYYPFLDSAAIIFHAPYIDLEVPLWPLERQGEDIIDFLRGCGVKVVNVQSDDKIPA
jgi:hypothetical protein